MLSSPNFKRFYHCCTRGCCARTSRSTVYLAPKTAYKNLVMFSSFSVFLLPNNFFGGKPDFGVYSMFQKCSKYEKRKINFGSPLRSYTVQTHKLRGLGIGRTFFGDITDRRTDVTDRTSGHLSFISHMYLVIFFYNFREDKEKTEFSD